MLRTKNRTEKAPCHGTSVLGGAILAVAWTFLMATSCSQSFSEGYGGFCEELDTLENIIGGEHAAILYCGESEWDDDCSSGDVVVTTEEEIEEACARCESQNRMRCMGGVIGGCDDDTGGSSSVQAWSCSKQPRP